MDFKKAFNSVWHVGLLCKLLKIHVEGHFYDLIKSLYSTFDFCLTIGHCKTHSLRYSRGVCQGCILRPVLFNLYLNNLPFSFQNTLSDPFDSSNGTKLNSLLYAADLIILSRSKTGLQNCLETLSSYCHSWMLGINVKKTKIMIFQKRARKSNNCNFFIDTDNIKIVQNYTFLGTWIPSTGNFNWALDHLKEKAMHALYSVRRHTDFSRLKPNLASKICHTIIPPILTDNDEAWGLYTKQDFKTWYSSPIEKVLLQFCKCYLETNNKASNLASTGRAELGRFPLIININ